MTAAFPPGRYELVVVGTGPGGLQISHQLRRLGIDHALLSADPAPGGMFRRLPVFQRLNTCSRRHLPAPAERVSPYRYDWNSLVSPEGDMSRVPELMSGDSYFPTRPEMRDALVGFAERAGVVARYDCRWEGTGIEDGSFVLATSEGEYRSPCVVLAVGMAEPWYADVPGLEDVPHYADLTDNCPFTYDGRRVFVVGKRNSAFELADALLPRARQVILGSPNPVRPSVVTGVPTPPRARYLIAYEDHRFGGGTLVLDAVIERVERRDGGYRVHTRPSSGDARVFEVDDVIAATGFQTPLGDLPALGLQTVNRGRLPALTPWWESVSTPGVFFAGAATQGEAAIRRHGLGTNSGAVVGFRWNAVVLARHLARTRFSIAPPRPRLQPSEVIGTVLSALAGDAALWNQPAHLARAITLEGGAVDEGIVPLAAFVDDAGPDAVAITVSPEPDGQIHGLLYIRSRGNVSERLLGPVGGDAPVANESEVTEAFHALELPA